MCLVFWIFRTGVFVLCCLFFRLSKNPPLRRWIWYAHKGGFKNQTYTLIFYLFHLWITLKQFDRIACISIFLPSPKQIPYVGSTTQDECDQFEHSFRESYIFPFTQLSYFLFHKHFYLSGQFPKPVFGHPYNMKITHI